MIDKVCKDCGHIHGEYVGLFDATAIYHSEYPDACKAAAEKYIIRVTRGLKR